METQLQEARPAETVLSGTANGSLVLNEGIYRKLADSMPTKQLLEMYAMCVNDARERIALMRGLAATHDGLRFTREAHAIKGGCGMLGATELHSMAAALEKSGLEGAGAERADEVNSLDELAAACDRLERMLGSRA
jgi:HPt (histidine-containing phosphotransfer) domain-containing protein